jgi:hypothetical protein
MVSIVVIFMGVVTALAAFAILAKTRRREPKKERVERGEILKQLLALSECENGISGNASPPTGSPLASTPAAGNRTLRKRPHREYADAEIEERIRQRAYELYQERGGVDGNATDDWQQAKEEVLSCKAKAAPTSS